MSQESPYVVAIYGSPRRQGNTARLLDACLRGVATWTPHVDRLVLRDLNISPCLEIYGCKRDGRCVIKDDFAWIADKLAAADTIILASPVMFYTVSAQAKLLIDRCQAFWVKKHLLRQPINPDKPRRQGAVIAAAASRGQRLFEGTIMVARYWFEALDVKLAATLCLRGLDDADDVLAHPEYLQQAYGLGCALREAADGGDLTCGQKRL